MKTKGKILAVLVAMAMLLAQAPVAFAAGEPVVIDLATVTGNGDGYTYSGSGADTVVTIISSGSYRFTSGADGSSTKIRVETGITADIMLDNVKISAGGGSAAPISVSPGSTVHLTLSGVNTLSSANGYAALHVPEGAAIDIAGDGKLYARAGTNNSATNSSGTGIGGMGLNGHAGSITINGGVIYAYGGPYAAGIGGGNNYNGNGAGSGNGGTITINGGVVYAYGNNHSAAIGGGCRGNGGNITINGGSIYAKGGTISPAIGAGFTGGAGNIRINGGMVTVEADYNVLTNTPSIGRDYTEPLGSGIASSITISGGTIMALGSNTNGGSYGPAIGRAGGDDPTTLTITGGSIRCDRAPLNPKDNNGNDLYLVGTVLRGLTYVISQQVDCTVNGHDFSAMTNEGATLFLWMPAGEQTIAVHIDGVTYSATLNVAPNNSNHVDISTVPPGVVVPVANVALANNTELGTSFMYPGETRTLIGTVAPTNATNQTIQWSLKAAGTTGATLNGSVLSAKNPGTLTVTATIQDGTDHGVDYTQDYEIPVEAISMALDTYNGAKDISIPLNMVFLVDVMANGTRNPTLSEKAVWDLTGNTSASTRLTLDSNHVAVLTTGGDESASQLNITATLTVNGIVYTDTVRIHIVYPEVTGVTVNPAAATVQKATTRSLAAAVTGPAATPSQGVTWSVSGGCAGTTISPAGLLTVAPEETAPTLTVTAISKTDNTKSGTASITVAEAPATVYGITIENDGNGTGVATLSTAAPGAIIMLSNTPNSGYHFKQWQVVSPSSLSIVGNSFIMPDEATVVKAIFEVDSYTVRFDSQGGSGVADQTIAYNGLATKPADPTRSDYTFSGWYKQAACTDAWDFATDQVTANTTLWAKWTISTYTVTFNSQGGSGVADQTVAYNGLATKPADPTRSNYTFSGWYKQAACTDAWDFATDQVTANTTLWAKWTISTYTVTFNSQGGTGVANQTITYNGLVTKPADPTRNGYTFGGWYKQTACTTVWSFVTDRVTANATLWAKWTAVAKYTVMATPNNASYGSVTGAGSYMSGTAITLKAMPKAGYRFVRWMEGTSAVSTSAEYKFTVTKARTLKAEFTVIAAPAVKATSAGYNSINLSWGAVAGAKEYEIYRAVSSNGIYSKITTTVAVSYTNAGLFTGTTYYYKVRAKCVAGSTTTYGGYSAIVSAKPVPATPTALKAVSASYTSIKLTWAAVSGATKYEIYRATASAGSYSKVAETASASFTNTGLTTGTAYYYKLRSYRLVGSTKIYGSYSSVVSTKPVPAAPTGVIAASASSKSIKVSWAAVAGATMYELWRSTASTGTYSLVVTVSATNYTNTGLVTGKTYYYKLRAYRLVGQTKVYGNYSAIVSAKP